MKKRKTIKIATLCAMVAIVLATAILPTFAIEYNENMTNQENCLMYWRGIEENLSYAYDYLYASYSTNGRILFFTAPSLSVYQYGSVVKSYPYFSPEDTYSVYIDCDDNAQYWYLDVYDPVNDRYDRYGLLETSCYMFKHQTLFPIIYTDNITNWGKDIADSMSEGFDPWLAIRIPSTNAVLVPSNYYDSVLKYGYTEAQINEIRQTEYNNGYGNGYTQGELDGYRRGEADGQAEVIRTENILLRFISAIFTAPGHLINTIFDFEIFGFNLANLIRVLLSLVIVGLAIWVIIKVI